ncbi:MAG: hypothetical protein HY042_13160 [Spirochaetia bacterium]|nr:hypothetical protein [Spirochaetia bacterium]
MVIVRYIPRAGKEDELMGLIREHLPVLQSQGYATKHPQVVMKAGDGSILEVFEWASPQAPELARGNNSVRALWERFASACEYERLSTLPEANQVFAHFEPLLAN